MLEPVHPVVPLGTEDADIFADLKGTMTSSIRTPPSTKVNKKFRKFQRETKNSNENDLTCGVVLGHIYLHWSSLLPSSRGLNGAFHDLKATCSRQKESTTRYTTQPSTNDAYDSCTKPSGITVDSQIESLSSLYNQKKTPNEKERVVVVPSHAKPRCFSSSSLARRSVPPQRARSLSSAKSGDQHAGTMYHSNDALSLRSTNSKEPSREDSTESLDESHVDVTAPLLNQRHHRAPTEHESFASLSSCSASQVSLTFRGLRGNIQWRSLLPLILKPIKELWAWSVACLNYISPHRKFMELKTHQTLRNITRRSHSICALLYFPAQISLETRHLGSKRKRPFHFTDSRRYSSLRGTSSGFRRSLVSRRSVAARSVASVTRNTPAPYNETTSHITFRKDKDISRTIHSTMTSKHCSSSSHSRALPLQRFHTDINDVVASRGKSFKPYPSFKLPRLRGHRESNRPPSRGGRINRHECCLLKSFKSFSTLFRPYECSSTIVSPPIRDTRRRLRSLTSVSVRRQRDVQDKGKLARSTVGRDKRDVDEFISDDNDSFVTLSTEDSTSNSRKDRDPFRLTYECGLASMWVPRLLLYGGAIHDSLEGNRGNASNWLVDVPLYSFIMDERSPSIGTKKTYSSWMKGRGDRSVARSRSIMNHVFSTQDRLLRKSSLKRMLSRQSHREEEQLGTSNNDVECHNASCKYLFRLNSTIFDLDLPIQTTPQEKERTLNQQKNKSRPVATSPSNRRSTVGSTLPRILQGIGVNWEHTLKQGETRATGLDAQFRLSTNLYSPPPRFGSASVVYRGRLYIFGGAGFNQWRQPTLMNDLWVLSAAQGNDSTDISARLHERSSVLGQTAGYAWCKVPLHTPLRPPPCAFHLAVVNDGFMYVIISDCTVADIFEDFPASFLDTIYNANEPFDQRLLLKAEYMRARSMVCEPQVLNVYERRLVQRKPSVNQIWRINLDSCRPHWEPFHVMLSKKMPMMISGGIALTSYNDRLFVYGTFTGHSHVVIGVLDIHLRMWVTTVRLPGAPVWGTAVAIGKLWFVLGVEVWGIFNLETFEWRYSNAPPSAQIRYGCTCVWLPPYIPFPHCVDISPSCERIKGLDIGDLKLLLRDNLTAQYFYLLLQKRRPLDHVHTILLLGGFDSKGELSNQVDQIVVVLPPTLAVNCFLPVWREANLFYASLFGVNAFRGQLPLDDPNYNVQEDYHEDQSHFSEKDHMIVQLKSTIENMKGECAERTAALEVTLRQVQCRFFAQQRQILEQLLNREYTIQKLKIKLQKERLKRSIT